MSFNLNSLWLDWRAKVPDGTPNPSNAYHLVLLKELCLSKGIDREIIDNVMLVLEKDGGGLDDKEKEKAKAKGLVSKGYGNWGPEDGDTTHKNVDGKLTPIGDDEEEEEDKPEPMKIDANPFDKEDEEDKEGGEEKPKGIVTGNPSDGDNQVKSDMFKHGYKKFEKATGTKPAPGGAGSAFNEIVSGEGVHLLEENPNMSDEELARKMYELTEDTALGKEQAQTPGTGKAPEGIKNKKLWSKCVVSARSAKKKYDRTQRRIERLQKDDKFGEPQKTSTFYGAKSSITAQVEMVKNANTILLPNGQVVTEQDAVAFIEAGGGGINPSDTATFVEDNDGNLLIQFHSDKTTTNDIQDNSTLSQEGENYKKTIDNLNLSENEKEESKKIIDDYSNQITEIEENYQREAVPVAQNLLQLPMDKQMEVLNKNPQTVQNNIEKSLFGANKKPPINSKFEKYMEVDKNPEELTLEEKYQIVIRYVADDNKLTDEITKVINKVGLAYEEKYPDTEGVNVKRNLSQQREKVVNMQRERINKLNEVKSGLGTRMEAEEASRAFHLTMMDYPPKKYEEGNPNSMIGSALDVNMGGNIVNGDVLRGCIGVKNSKDFTDNFELKETDDLTYDKETGTVVTGKKVYTYIVDKDGNKTEIGYKSYRSKNGAAGKTDNTMTYSTDMQNCFKGKN
jgi:hypothetical protein